MTTPYIQSKRHKVCKCIFWILIALLLLCLAACAKQTPTTEIIANSAQESLNAINNTLTPECKTKAIESQINATNNTIKAMVSACNIEKDAIDQEKLRWKWAFIALTIIVAIHIGRKVI